MQEAESSHANVILRDYTGQDAQALGQSVVPIHRHKEAWLVEKPQPSPAFLQDGLDNLARCKGHYSPCILPKHARGMWYGFFGPGEYRLAPMVEESLLAE